MHTYRMIAATPHTHAMGYNIIIQFSQLPMLVRKRCGKYVVLFHSMLPFNSITGQLHRGSVIQSAASPIATPIIMLMSTALFLVTVRTCPYYPEVHQAVNRCFKRRAVCTRRANANQYIKVKESLGDKKLIILCSILNQYGCIVCTIM